MNDIPYIIEYIRAVMENDEQQGIVIWLGEIYQSIEDLRLEDIYQLIRGAKSFALSLWGKSQIFLVLC